MRCASARLSRRIPSSPISWRSSRTSCAMPPTTGATPAASRRCASRSRRFSSRFFAPPHKGRQCRRSFIFAIERNAVVPAEESTPAIVLRARDYSESDRIVTLLTREFGKLSGIAKGAKASRRRFERKLEPFSHVVLHFKRRPHGQLVFITRAEAADLAQHVLDDDLAKIALGSYMLELTDALTTEESEAAEAYRV